MSKVFIVNLLIFLQNKYVHQSPESENEFGGMSLINVDNVDLVKHYEISKLNYSQVTLNAGDCIYMPSSKLNKSIFSKK